jgi:glycosyltransferase 2 family protein
MNNIIINLIKIVFIIFIFYYLYQNNHININALLTFKENALLNIFLVIIIFITLLLGSLRWFIILKYSKIKINYIETFKIIYICSFFNNFMFGNIGGDFLRVFYATKLSNVNKIQNAFTIFVDRLFGLIGLVALGFFSFIAILFNYNQYKILIYILPILIISTILIIITINLFKKNKKIIDLIVFLNLSKKLIIFGILISILLFFTVHFSIFCISNYVFDFKIDLHYIFFANFISSLVGAIPIAPGGIGLSEAAFVFINNSLFKIYLENLANILIYYRIIIFISSLPSLYFFFKYKRN